MTFIGNWKLNIGNWAIVLLVIAGVFVVAPRHASAGLLLNAPTYTGLNRGLVGYWSFNQPDMYFDGSNIKALDRSGNGNMVSPFSSEQPKMVPGKVGQAARFFAGTGQAYFEIGDPIPSSLALTGSASFSAWVYLDSINAGSVDDGIIIRNPSTISYHFKFTEDCGQENLSLQISSNGSGFGQRCSATVISTKQWYHVAAVYNATAQTIDVYVNGQLDNGALLGTVPSSIYNNGDFVIGGGNGGSLKGIIDEARVYNRVLTADEIKRLYKIGSTLKIGVSRTSDSTLNKGLVGYWTFDENNMGTTSAWDSSGNGNTGWLAPSATNKPKRAVGKIGQGLSFNGTNNYVDIGQPASLNLPGTITICAWVYPHSFPNGSESMIVNNDSGSNMQYDLEIENDNSFAFYWNNSGSISSLTSGPSVITLNRWMHLCGSHYADPTTGQLYLNGAPIVTTFNSGGDSSVPTSGFGNTWIGSGIPSKYFDGTIDDVRIYNRALSADEIKRLYNLGGTMKVGKTSSTGSLSTGLVGHWTFDENKMGTTSAWDSSGNGNTGWLAPSSTNKPKRAAGKIGQGLNFDGVDDYIALGNPASLQQIDSDHSWTISMWYKSNSASSNTRDLLYWGGTTGGFILKCGYSYGNNRCVFEQQGGSYQHVDSVSNAFTPNVWQHLVVAGSGSSLTIRFFINGVDVTGVGNPDFTWMADGANTEKFNIGFGYSSTGWNGLIDDVRIYNRALSPDEIKRLYNMGDGH